MDSSTFCLLFFFLVLIVVALLNDRNIFNSKKKIILVEILQQGGEVIEISSKHLWGSKGHYNYRIVFRDQSGQKHQTTCIAYMYGNELFWSKTPAELMSGVQIANAPSVFNRVENEHMELTTKSSKEQIIDDLHEENLRLKEKLERLRNNSGKIE